MADKSILPSSKPVYFGHKGRKKRATFVTFDLEKGGGRSIPEPGRQSKNQWVAKIDSLAQEIDMGSESNSLEPRSPCARKSFSSSLDSVPENVADIQPDSVETFIGTTNGDKVAGWVFPTDLIKEVGAKLGADNPTRVASVSQPQDNIAESQHESSVIQQAKTQAVLVQFEDKNHSSKEETQREREATETVIDNTIRNNSIIQQKNYKVTAIKSTDDNSARQEEPVIEDEDIANQPRRSTWVHREINKAAYQTGTEILSLFPFTNKTSNEVFSLFAKLGISMGVSEETRLSTLTKIKELDKKSMTKRVNST